MTVLVCARDRSPAPFAVRLERDRETITVKPVGELDIATTAALRREVAQLVSAGFRVVVIDLRGLDFIDCAGLRLLLELNAASRADGWRLSLTQGPRAVRRLFELTATLHRLPFA